MHGLFDRGGNTWVSGKISGAQGYVFEPGYGKTTIAITEITFQMMKDSLKSLELWWKVKLQKKKDAGMSSRKRKTDELQNVNEEVKVILIPLLKVFPQKYQASNA